MGWFNAIKAAFSPQRYLDASNFVLGGWGAYGARPRPFNPDAAVRAFNHWAYAATMLNANAVANVPRRLYAKSQSPVARRCRTAPIDSVTRRYLLGLSTDRPSRAVQQKVQFLDGDLVEIVDDHFAASVLRKVNPWQNGYEFDVLRMIDLQISGNAYIHPIIGSGGYPVQVWRMPPQYVKVVPGETDLIKEYRYGVNGAAERVFSVDEVIQFRMPNPSDLFYGRGWYEAAWTALGLHESKRDMDLAKFDNMARPDYLLSMEGATPEMLQRFSETVKNQLGGTKKAGKFLAVGSRVTATPLNFDIEEVGTSMSVVQEIAAVSGVPVSMLVPDRAATALESSRVQWYRQTIRPYCRLDEEKLNERWLPLFPDGEELVIAYDMVSFEDRAALAKELLAYVGGGVLTQNEARRELGYGPLNGGDVLFQPAGSGSGNIDAMTGEVDPLQNQSQIGD